MSQRAERMREPSETSGTGALPLLAAVRGCGVGLWSIDGAGVFHADNTLLSIWGRSDDELIEAESSAPACWVHPDDRAQLEAVLRSNAAPEDDLETMFRVLRPDGSERWVLCRRYTLPPAEEIAGIMLDVTSYRIRDEVRARGRTSEGVATLAARLSHDFNNLLFAILGNATLALGAMQLPPDHPVRESLHEIERAATRATDIVQRLSAFARPVQPRRQLLKLGTLVDSALRAARDTLPANVLLQTSFPNGEPSLLVDPRLVHDLVGYLLTNAVHACEGRVAMVNVEIEEVVLATQPWFVELAVEPGRYLELRVRDAGHGMEPATLQRALEPFFSTRPKGLGMGLGLSIANGIMKSHQGALRLESSRETGTTAHVYFPLPG